MKENGNRRHEIAGCLRPVGVLKPVAQVDDYTHYTGEERGLRRAQQEAGYVQMPGCLDQPSQHRQHSPGDHAP